jgi:cysteine desulfurase/selenocysteine lyase
MSDRLPLAAAADTFPVLAQTVHGQPLAYLDNAATTQVPQPVLAAMRHFEAHERANIHRGVHTLSQRATDAFELARSTLKAMSAPMPGTNWCSPRARPRL